MARLGAIAKALYFPSPDRVVGLIRDAVKVQCGIRPITGRLLDPCAGEGRAAADLGAAWGLETYGVELHTGRAAAAVARMTACLSGSYHQLKAPEGAFSVLFLNPPYDEGFAHNRNYRRSVRQETTFLKDTIKYLRTNGLLILIVPAKMLDHYDFLSTIHNNFSEHEAYRFPDPEYGSFKQAVVFGIRRDREAYSYTTWAVDSLRLPVLGERLGEHLDGQYRDGATVELPDVGVGPIDFRLHGENPYEIAPDWEANEGCYGTQQWKILTGISDLNRFDRPLLPPRPGHQAMLLAAGCLNGTEIGGSALIKGHSSKITIAVDDPDAQKRYERERIVSHMATLDLLTGQVDSWQTDGDKERTEKWFKEYGPALGEAIRVDHRAIFNGEVGRYDFSGIHAPGILPGHTEPVLLEKQKEAAAAIVYRWRDYKSAVLCGEQGVGKTIAAVAATTVAGFRKVVVVCPTHLTKKWVREVEVETGHKGCALIGKKLKDVDKFFADPKFRYLILSNEMAKLGARWIARTAKKKVMVTRTVEDRVEIERRQWNTWRRDYEDITDVTYVPREVKERSEVLTCPRCGEVLRDEENNILTLEYFEEKKRACLKCGERLWQVAPISSLGTRRWPLARYINRHHAGRFALVIDECHQHASVDSDRSRAVQHLATSATHILAMTGTLYGGRASSIFHLLYKVDPQFRSLYQYNECPVFVGHHGLLETVYDTEEKDSIYGYRRQNSGGRVHEIPGVNPAVITLLLPYTVFLRLEDLGYELPPYHEEVVMVDHDPVVEQAARDMASEVKSVLREHPKLLGQYLMACLGYPDCPEHAEEIAEKDWRGDVEKVIATAPAFPAHVWPKDQKLIDICNKEKAEGRKVLVYFSQVNKRSPIPRIKKFLEERGLRGSVLSASVEPSKREEWLRALAAKENPDVLLTNGRLVETGLDLIDFPTIVQFGTEYSISTLRQSWRRSWRLGQTKPVRVVCLGYRRTMQQAAMTLIAKKMRAAELVDGAGIGGLSQHDDSGGNFFLELARECVGLEEAA